MTTAVRKAGIIAGHFIVLVIGCGLIGLAITGLERAGLPVEIGPVFSFVIAMPWGVFIFMRAADKIGLL